MFFQEEKELTKEPANIYQPSTNTKKITLNGKFEMKKIEIDKSLLDEEDTSILEDMIVAAYNDAHGKVDASMAEGMKDVTGGLNLGGLKLPF